MTPARQHQGERILTCDECDHFFDRADERCFVSTRGNGALCPLCAEHRLRGSEAWAVWNSCNGVFTDTVHVRRFDAANDLTQALRDAGSIVVPVRIYREAESRELTRYASEAEWEHYDNVVPLTGANTP